MFEGCSSLESLPDISKWNTNNVTDMSRMFKGCELLKLLPDWYYYIDSESLDSEDGSSDLEILKEEWNNE